jgi:uncharacterized Zn-binding protein involved in type VI secretion
MSAPNSSSSDWNSGRQFNSPLVQQPWEQNANSNTSTSAYGSTKYTSNSGQWTTSDKDSKALANPPPNSTTKVELFNQTYDQKTGYVGALRAGSGSNTAQVGVLYGKYYRAGRVTLDQVNGLQATGRIEVKGSLIHGEGQFSQNLFTFGGTHGPAIPVPPGMAPLAARVTDLTAHGSRLLPGIGSLNVFIGGLPAWRQIIDLHICSTDGMPGKVLKGTSKVLINKFEACRVGDLVVETGAPNAIAKGCPTVKIGQPGPGLGPPPNDAGSLAVDGKATGDIGTASATLEGGLTVKPDEVSLKAKAGAMAAVFRGQAEGGLTLKFPGWMPLIGGHSVHVGVAGEATALSAGASAEGGVGYNKSDGAFVKFGAKAALGAGLGGNILIGVK